MKLWEQWNQTRVDARVFSSTLSFAQAARRIKTGAGAGV